jgi:hypothetical protein
VRNTGTFFVNTSFGDGKGGEDDVLYVVNRLGGEEEIIKISLEAIFEPIEETLRRAQVKIS